MGYDFQIRKVATSVLAGLVGQTEIPKGKLRGRFDREMRHLRFNPRIMQLLGLPIKTTKRNKILPIENPFPSLPPLAPRDFSEDTEIMIRAVTHFIKKNERHFEGFSEKLGVGPVEFLDAYLRVNDLPIDQLSERAFASTLFSNHFQLSPAKSFLYSLYLNLHPVSDLAEFVPVAAKAFGVPTEEFLDIYAKRFANLPPKDLGQLAEAIIQGSEMLGLDKFVFLERLAFIDLRIKDVLERMAVPKLGDFELTPWRTFREKIAWKIKDRQIMDPNAMQSLKIMFMIDSAYAWGTEGPLRFAVSKGALGYQVFDASANVIMAAIVDFFLSWKSMSTATGAALASNVYQTHRVHQLKDQVEHSQNLALKFTKWVALQKATLIQNLRSRSSYRYSELIVGRMALMGAVGVGAGLIGGGVVQGVDHLIFRLDPSLSVEDRFLATLFYAGISGAWMGFSAAPRYLGIMTLSKRLSNKFPDDPSKVAKIIAPVGIANSIFGAVGFTFLCQRPFINWYREGGGKDQIQEYWDDLKSEVADLLGAEDDSDDSEDSESSPK